MRRIGGNGREGRKRGGGGVRGRGGRRGSEDERYEDKIRKLMSIMFTFRYLLYSRMKDLLFCVLKYFS